MMSMGQKDPQLYASKKDNTMFTQQKEKNTKEIKDPLPLPFKEGDLTNHSVTNSDDDE